MHPSLLSSLDERKGVQKSWTRNDIYNDYFL